MTEKGAKKQIGDKQKMKKMNLEKVVREVCSGSLVVVQVQPTESLKGDIKGIAKDEGMGLLEDNYGLLSEAVQNCVLSPSKIQMYDCMDPRIKGSSEDTSYLVGMISSRDWFNPSYEYADSEIVGTRLERGLLLIRK